MCLPGVHHPSARSETKRRGKKGPNDATGPPPLHHHHPLAPPPRHLLTQIQIGEEITCLSYVTFPVGAVNNVFVTREQIYTDCVCSLSSDTHAVMDEKNEQFDFKH